MNWDSPFHADKFWGKHKMPPDTVSLKCIDMDLHSPGKKFANIDKLKPPDGDGPHHDATSDRSGKVSESSSELSSTRKIRKTLLDEINRLNLTRSDVGVLTYLASLPPTHEEGPIDGERIEKKKKKKKRRKKKKKKKEEEEESKIEKQSIPTAYVILVAVILLLSTLSGGVVYYLVHHFKAATEVIENCNTALKAGYNKSGVFRISPNNKMIFSVWCDMDTDGGGWTVIQRRSQGTVSFLRSFNHYELGFGMISKEHWLGNRQINILTERRHNELRVDIVQDGQRKWAKYSYFSVGDQSTLYQLRISGYSNSSTAEDGLTKMPNHFNMGTFSSGKIVNRGQRINRCKALNEGGFWLGGCNSSHLNGLWINQQYSGVRWGTFAGKITSTKLMVRIRGS